MRRRVLAGICIVSVIFSLCMYWCSNQAGMSTVKPLLISAAIMAILIMTVFFYRSKTNLFKEISRDCKKREEENASVLEQKKQDFLVRLNFEKAASIISSRFIGLSDMDTAINESLKDMGEISKADRSYLFIINKQRDRISNTHEWCREGAVSYMDRLQDLPLTGFPWWKERLYNTKIIDIPDVSMLPEEASAEKRLLESQGIKSLLVLPVYISGRISGFIGFDNIMEFGEWGQNAHRLLEICSQIIGTALERRKARMELAESEEKYRLLFIHAPLGIFHYNIDYQITDTNERLARELGSTRKDLIGLNVLKVKDKRIMQCLRAPIEKGMSDNYRGGYAATRLGKDWEVSIRTAPFFGRDGQITGAIGMVENTTMLHKEQLKKRQLEKRLHQAQKMEAIGTMAGGIAHDFNNLLMGIQGNASLILKDMDKDSPFYERLIHINRHVNKGEKLTRQMLGFAREGKYETKSTDMNNLLAQSLALFGRTKKEILIQEDFEQDLWGVDCDRGQIEQVLLNLYVNAWQAMPEGGLLSVGTKNVIIERNSTAYPQAAPGKYIRIDISDTGKGMDKETIKRIFEPFFTTKEVGKGSGMGLASAFGIIQNHSGMINCQSIEDAGTTFIIHLPANDKTTMPLEPDDSQKVNTLPHTENKTILVVDDEELILMVAGDMLDSMGYKVLRASSGQEAVAILKGHKKEIAIVVLDMIMPGMSGTQTYQALKEISPDLKCILSSGYSKNEQAEAIMEQGCNGFIQKPFDLERLSAALKNALDET
ncbi:MAG: response regulator [Thermodesulfobacteriota bacterium]|nr:response regulator [Thermodesulfobacteriota bacterium]